MKEEISRGYCIMEKKAEKNRKSKHGDQGYKESLSRFVEKNEKSKSKSKLKKGKGPSSASSSSSALPRSSKDPRRASARILRLHNYALNLSEVLGTPKPPLFFNPALVNSEEEEEKEEEEEEKKSESKKNSKITVKKIEKSKTNGKLKGNKKVGGNPRKIS